MYVLSLYCTWLASSLGSYLASSISLDRSAIAPCLAKSLTQAPSKPTTSGSVFDAAPVTSCCLVEAYGALSSLTLMVGFCVVKSAISLSNAPDGSSGAHHCANSSVTLPPELALSEPPEPQAPTNATSKAPVTAPSSRFIRDARTAMASSFYRDPSFLRGGPTLAACYVRGQ